MEQQHAIRKLVVEVQLPSREEAFSLQGALSTRCNTELVPMLAELLDGWADPDTLLQIDKLEIDLGSCSIQALREDLPELVITYLRKHFQSMLTTGSPGLQLQRRPLVQGHFDSWLHFMEHGVLPSSAVKWEQEEWEAGILTALATETPALRRCQQLFVDHSYAVRRLVMQFSRGFIYNWILACSAGAHRQSLVLMEEWETFVFSTRFANALEQQFKSIRSMPPVLPEHTIYAERVMEWLIREIVVTGKTISHPALLEQLIRLLGSGKELPDYLFALERVAVAGVKMPVTVHEAVAAVAGRYGGELSVRRQQFSRGHDVERQLMEQDGGKMQQPPAEKNAHTERGPADLHQRQVKRKSAADGEGTGMKDNKRSSIQPDNASAEGTAPFKTHPEKSDVERKEAYAATDSETFSDNNVAEKDDQLPGHLPEEGTVYYINNAGLILLHPYLSYCFDALGLREGREFKDAAARHKAVQLVGYMAYGEGDIPEYDLVLPKLLCGITPAEPIKRFVPLSDVEKEEADQLLTAVITHWNALGNTSPDGLRGNFLLREGKLEWKEEEWQLYVTQQAYDMLLNRLPWGFSVVGLSWMPWLIKTVWI